MNADDVVTVYTLHDPNEAEVVKILLRDHDIDCELDGEHQAGFSGVFEIGVLVRAEDADKARDVIQMHHLDDNSGADNSGADDSGADDSGADDSGADDSGADDSGADDSDAEDSDAD